jgi:hypothetical protein
MVPSEGSIGRIFILAGKHSTYKITPRFYDRNRTLEFEENGQSSASFFCFRGLTDD